jgi:tol-pal system protein YbgF
MSRPQIDLTAGTVLAFLVANTALAKPIPVHDGSIAGMEARVLRLERLLNSGHQLQLYQQLTTLQQELERLRGTLEQSQHRIQQLEKQLKSFAATMPQPAEGEQAAATTSSMGAPLERSDNPTPQRAQSERLAYEQAWQAVKSLPTPEGLQHLEQFIKNYPQSSYLPNAYYWSGQLLFRQGELSRASHYFAKVLQAFPKSAKCSEAMLKIGIITQKQGDTTKAKAIYQRVVQQYPSSSSAEQAKSRLSQLK